MNCGFHVAHRIMCAIVIETIGGCEHVKLEDLPAVVADRNDKAVGGEYIAGVRHPQDVAPSVAVRVGEIRLMEGLVEGLSHEVLVKLERIVTDECRW